MASNNLTEIARSLTGLLYNPEMIFKAQIDTLEKISDGTYAIIDPTAPFPNLMEMAAMVGASLKFDREVTLRKKFPSLSQVYEDLYLHMSSEAYLSRFSTPAITPFNILLRKDEIINSAVLVDNTTSKKLVIPRYTAVTIAGVTHTLSYPIEFRVLSHGGLQVVYDTTEQNPIQLLESNIIDYRIVKDRSGVESMLLTVPLAQYAKDTYFDSLNPSTGFTKTYSFDDQFYYCRVYGVQRVGDTDVYTEFATTHSEIIYDIGTPTALLRVLEDSIRVEIPQVYFNTNQLPAKIRIDVFTSRGLMNMDLQDYDANAFSVEWGDGLVTPAESVYTSPINQLAVKGAWSSAIIQGGANAKSFAEMRDMVITSSTNPKIVITDAQLKSRLQLRGYDVVLAIDNISNRVFYATRNLPPPVATVTTDGEVDQTNFTTGAGCSIDSIQLSMEDIASLPYVRDNGLRMTITPQALYQYNNGIVKLLQPSQIPVEGIAGLDGLVATVNAGNYAYSPFYYVLDATTNIFDCRAYHLDGPKITSRTFVAENQTSGLQISTSGYFIEKVEGGYRLLVTTVSDDAYKELDQSQLHVQISYRPPVETRDAYLNGTLYGTDADGEYVWEFFLSSELDITSEDRMFLDNFVMYTDDYRSFMSNLSEQFNIYYAVSDYENFGMEQTDIDVNLGIHLLPEGTRGLTHEKLTIEFGVALKNLWINGRTVSSSITYQVYEEDVPYVRPDTKYVEDANGIPIFTMVEGVLTYEVVYRKGDPVIINGEVQMQHRKGDPVRVDGEPVPVTGRKTLRLIDVFLVDGVYYYASNLADVNYKQSIPESVVKFLREDLTPMSSSLIQGTKLYYYPKKTIGTTKMIVGNQIEASLPAGLSFAVRHYLNGNVYRDEERRAAIKRTTMEVINRRLSRSTVSVGDITESIKDAVGDDTMAIDMDKMGPFKDIAAFTAIDDSRRCSVKRVLEVQSDQRLRVIEDVAVDFLLHRA